MERSVSWMQGYNDYYNEREFNVLFGIDYDEWLQGAAYAMDEEFEAMTAGSQ